MRLDEAARAYLGVPFRHQGRDPAIGIDCIGLIVLAGRDAGMAFPAFDRTDYGTEPVDGMLQEMLRLAFGPPVSPMQVGDVVAIDFKGVVRHVGIVGQHPQGLSLIHTNMAVGRVTEARIDSKWANRIKGIFRVR